MVHNKLFTEPLVFNWMLGIPVHGVINIAIHLYFKQNQNSLERCFFNLNTYFVIEIARFPNETDFL